MRTLLAAIVVAALIVTGVAIVVPLIAKPMIVAAAQRESPFGDQHLDIDVDCNVFGLLQGSIDRVHVHGTDLKHGDVTIGALDVTMTGVATSGRAFRDAAGDIVAITVLDIEGNPVTIDEASMYGSSSALRAIVNLDRAEATQLIASTLSDGGVDVSDIRIGNDVVMFTVFGSDAVVQVALVDGAMVLVDPFGQGDFVVLAPLPTDGWTFTRASMTGEGLRIDASVDVAKLLASN